MWAEFRHPTLLYVWLYHTQTLLKSVCRPTAYLQYRKGTREDASHDFIQLLWYFLELCPWWSHGILYHLTLIPLMSLPMRKRMSLTRTIVMITTEKSLKCDGTLEFQQEVITIWACLYIYGCYFAPWNYISFCKLKNNSNFNFWIHCSITNNYRNYVIEFYKCY